MFVDWDSMKCFFNGDKIGDHVLAPAVTNYDKRSLKKLCIIMMTSRHKEYFIMY